jgi:hypothetical protein
MPESVCLREAAECLEAKAKPKHCLISTILDIVIYADSYSDEEVELSSELQELVDKTVGKISDT